MRKGILALLASTTQLAGLALAQAPPSLSPYHASVQSTPIALGKPVPLDAAIASAGPDLIVPVAVQPTPQNSPSVEASQDIGPPAVTHLPPGQAPEFPAPTAPLSGAFCQEPAPRASCLWIDGEYLLWWSKGQPLPFTSENLDYGAFSGFRITVGGWLDSERQFGLEGRAFWLPEQTAGISAATPGSFPIPGLGLSVASAQASVTSNSTLFGADLNGVYSLYRGSSLHAELLGGFRYVGLDENLTASASGMVNFPSGTASASAVAAFHTLNDFYGGQIGARAGGRWGRFTADITGTVALGATQESLDLDALATETVGKITKTDFANPHLYRTPFSVVPEAQARVGYDVTKSLKLFVAYDFLYMSIVARPGDQALSFVPPAHLQTTSYWAQGITFGAEYRF